LLNEKLLSLTVVMVAFHSNIRIKALQFALSISKYSVICELQGGKIDFRDLSGDCSWLNKINISILMAICDELTNGPQCVNIYQQLTLSSSTL
jgi:hypothetical protein